MALGLKLALRGNLEEQLEKEFRLMERVAKRTMVKQVKNVQTDLRQDVERSGIRNATKIANAWRSRVYPVGENSANAAGFIYSKAPKVIQNLELARPIVARNRKYLAIPTPDARRLIKGTPGRFTVGARGGGSRDVRRRGRLSPSNFPEARFGKLRFVPTRKGGLLIAPRARPVLDTAGSITGFRRAGKRQATPGIVMFFLVRQARPKKRLNVQEIAVRGGDTIAKEFNRAYLAEQRDLRSRI